MTIINGMSVQKKGCHACSQHWSLKFTSAQVDQTSSYLFIPESNRPGKLEISELKGACLLKMKVYNNLPRKVA